MIPSVECEKQFYEKEGYPIKIMAWACISKGYKPKLIKIEGNMNTESYQNMLAGNKIFEILNDRFGPKDFIFRQDGARMHSAK